MWQGTGFLIHWKFIDVKKNQAPLEKPSEFLERTHQEDCLDESRNISWKKYSPKV
jgi:hypothetical protein